MTADARYVKPKKSTNLFNESVARLTKMGISVFFDGVDAKAPEETLRGIAPGYPVFRIERTG